MKNKDIEKTLIVQKDQIEKTEDKLLELENYLENVDEKIQRNHRELNDVDKKSEYLFEQLGINRDKLDLINAKPHIALSKNETDEIDKKLPGITLIDFVNRNNTDTWDNFTSSVNHYITNNNLIITDDPFRQLLSNKQREEIEKRLKDEYTIKKCNCDKYDYMIAATCGAIGGLIDAFFVGIPGSSSLGNFTDEQTNKIVQKFSKVCGWPGAREGSDPTKSAIGFLENKFKVNYDHRHGGDVDGLFKMSTKNHHLKSLSHSPDIIGLIFSIINQFTNTASFVDNGKIITIKTKNYELQGHNFIARIFCGFINWLGHIMSDIAGSSGAKGRGSGLPIPFYGLLQFINIGNFGQHRQTFAKIAVQVFERGYDFRHGLALAIPVAITEILIRMMYTIKRHYYHKQSWKESIPFGKLPELRRMLLVGHGTLCLIDLTDAGLKSGGEPVQLFLRMNFIGWVRFGILGFKEIVSIYNSGRIDTKLIDKDLEVFYNKTMQENKYLSY